MICIKNGTLVSSQGTKKADLWIEGGKIIEAPENPVEFEVYDAEGCYVFPGFIDSHTHLQMPLGGGMWTADDFESGTSAAISGGTTMILDFATQDRGHSLGEALDTWHSRADGHCHCDYGFHMAITDWNDRTRAELRDMVNAGITSFKTYMAYDSLRISDDDLCEVLTETRKLGAIVGVHCELGDEVNSNIKALLAEGKTEPQWHPVSRQNDVESRAVSRFMELAKKANAPAWVVHLSTAEGLDAIEDARKNGQHVLVETCPQYLTLTDEVYIKHDFESAKYVCSPPIRREYDKQILLKALESEVDIISTDHCSFNFIGQKEQGRKDFSKIPNGLPGIEHRPALVWTYCKLSAERFCELMSETPAKAFGMYPQKGSLMPGSDADVVVWDTGYRGKICAEEQIMKADYNPWEGYEINARAKYVFLRGQSEKYEGKFIPRGKTGV